MGVTDAEVKESEYNIRRAAAIIGILQSLTWIILSIICIAFYIKDTEFPLMDSYMSYIKYCMYGMLLSRQAEPWPKQVLTPTTFFGFMWVYLIFDATWLVASARILRRSSGIQIANDTRIWSIVTFMVCILDFIIVAILGSDYNHCLDMYIYQNPSLEELCANGLLIPMVIVAKGFVLWIINVIFGVVLLNMSKRSRAREIYQAASMNQPIGQPYGYAAPTSPQNWNSGGAPYQHYQEQMGGVPQPYQEQMASPQPYQQHQQQMASPQPYQQHQQQIFSPQPYPQQYPRQMPAPRN